MLREMFDHYIESSVVGLRKPDPAIFQHTLDLLGVKGSETAFLDDIGLCVALASIALIDAATSSLLRPSASAACACCPANPRRRSVSLSSWLASRSAAMMVVMPSSDLLVLAAHSADVHPERRRALMPGLCEPCVSPSSSTVRDMQSLLEPSRPGAAAQGV